MDELSEIMKKVILENGLLSANEIADKTRNTHFIDYNSVMKIINGYSEHKNLRENDKYKHAVLNCKAAQNGVGGAFIGSVFSGLKENYDVL